MQKARILVVEDNAVLQRVVQLLAARIGVQVNVVSSGQDALAEVQSGQPYSLILMDWRLPDMDGLECTRKIRTFEEETGEHLPIIAMTGNVEDEHRRTCMDVGMDDFMSKPFSQTEFCSMLNRWLPSEQQACS